MIRAAVFRGVPGRLTLEAFARPMLEEGEVLVRVMAATICGSDRHTVEGRRHVPMPTVLGHEIVGEVVESKRPDVAKGERVTWAIVANCGSCGPCGMELPQKCVFGHKYGHEAFGDGASRSILSGGFAEMIVLAAKTHVVQVPDHVPLAVAAPANCATATVMAAVEGMGAGRSVLIAGCGLLGLTACAVMRSRGASRIVAVDPDAGRRSRAVEFGADEAHEPGDRAIPEEFDAALDFAGDSDVISWLLTRLCLAGRLVLVGRVAPGPSVSVDPERIVRRCLTIRGVHNYAPRHLDEAVDFLGGKGVRFPFEAAVGRWFALDEIETAFRLAAQPAHLRIGIRPSPDS
jgi:putative phosphonate catabolism associated alcohol dehydrogenase